MRGALFKETAGKRALNIDPRTKLLLLLTMAVFVFSSAGAGSMFIFRILLTAVSLLLILSSGSKKKFVTVTAVIVAAYFMQFVIVPLIPGAAAQILMLFLNLLTHFAPSFIMAYFVISSTTVSEFNAAMERIHMPNAIIIPMSVMFRFFPTIKEEFAAIDDAMRMRGIRFGGGKVGAMLEYRLVPMMSCCVRIGEELSASALTRGLGAPGRRTNICDIGFHVQDILLILLCVLAFVMWILLRIHVL